jgi:hypothetical protein
MIAVGQTGTQSTPDFSRARPFRAPFDKLRAGNLAMLMAMRRAN